MSGRCPKSRYIIKKSHSNIISCSVEVSTRHSFPKTDHTLASAKTMKCFCFFLFSRVVSFYLTSWLTQNSYVCNILIMLPLRKTQEPSPKAFVRKIPQRCGIWQIKPMPSLDQDQLSLKLKNSGFWTFWTSKFTNFKTRLWTHGTCHVSSESTMW